MYLRLVALDEFTGAEWRSSGWHDDAPPNPPWPVTGLAADVAADRVTTVVEATPGYAQTSLPVPYPALSIAFADAEAGADPVEGWSFDRGTQTLFRPDGEASTQGRTWRVEHLLVRPTAEQLAGAPAAPQEMSDYYTQLPSDLPAEVAATARDVTAGAANAYEQAVALQEWFTQRGGFRYDTSVASGSGSEAIVDFLRRKEGFCVHFAFTMAAMARTLDIPAQVAVGFTPGERRPDGSYDVGIHNAHAWPELYFEGVGWVRFEPTPGQGNAPSYTRPEESRPEQEEPEQTEPTPRPETEDPSPSPSPSPSQRCDEPGGCGEQPRTPDDDRDEAGLPLLGPALWIGGALLVLAVPAAPVLWRRRRRARRLAPAAGVLGAWRELLDTAWDFGITPVAAETPRQAAERVVRVTGLAGEPAGAVHRVAAAVEEELYAPPAAHGIRPGGRNPAADVRAACAGLRAGASRWERLRATFLPRSAVRVRDGVRERWAGLRLPRFAGRPRPARR
jgi:transglutaminase-like putative cysteine protease